MPYKRLCQDIMPHISDYTTTPKNPPKSQKTPGLTGPYVEETLLRRGQVQAKARSGAVGDYGYNNSNDGGARFR